MQFLIDTMHMLGGKVQALGPWGDLTLFALFIVSATFSFLPRPVLCVIAGVACGYWGAVLAVGGTLLGSILVYGVGHLFAARLLGYAGRHPKVMALLDAVHEEGWRAVLLFRLAPSLPSSLLSLTFGLCKVNFWPYCLATMVGTAPAILLEVTIGAAGKKFAQGELAHTKMALIGLGVAAGLFAVFLVTRQAKKRIANRANVRRSEIG